MLNPYSTIRNSMNSFLGAMILGSSKFTTPNVATQTKRKPFRI
jgi:hypothetical protein